MSRSTCFAVALLLLASTVSGQRSVRKQSSPARVAKAVPPAAPAIVPIQFEDVTRTAGIDFHPVCGTREKLYIMDALCGGVGFIDYDRDGWPDIILLNGSTIEQLGAGTAPTPQLYHNNHDGTFTEVAGKLGLTHRGWGMGVAVGDYDGDGWPDLYLTYLNGGVLYHNDAGKGFTDVTAKAGVANGGQWGTSAAWGDYDNDGHLDLYIANYVDIDLAHLPEFGSNAFCQYRGIKVSCGPRGLKGARDRLYRNRGDGTFEDVTEKLNIDPSGFYGLGVIFLDYDGDGCQDIYVADDSSPSQLYKGDCHGGLTEVGVVAGVAYSEDGQEQAGMGVDAADYDGDGRIDITKINFSDDVNNLYHNDGAGGFTDRNGPAGYGPISTPYLGFGVRFADFDNDGWPDIFIANGHVNPQVDGHRFGVTYAERNLLFRNLGNGRFTELGEKAAVSLRIPRVCRGLAVADFDRDGRLDVLISNLDTTPLLLHNISPGKNHWVEFEVEQGTGARVAITLPTGARRVGEVRANSSYLSSSDPAVHFGLGGNDLVTEATVRWPDGKVVKLTRLAANRRILVARPH